jgi:cellobiose-specific phosphotransferase system component IIA
MVEEKKRKAVSKEMLLQKQQPKRKVKATRTMIHMEMRMTKTMKERKAIKAMIWHTSPLKLMMAF